VKRRGAVARREKEAPQQRMQSAVKAILLILAKLNAWLGCWVLLSIHSILDVSSANCACLVHGSGFRL
jgi:hypothetical protein